MERYRLRVRHEPKRGSIWELKLFPQHPFHGFREADGQLPGSCSTPEAAPWLRHLPDPFRLRAEAPEPITAEKFGPQAEPRWLKPEDGMRLALAFSAARYLEPKQRRLFRDRLDELPSEVVLYWFTLCFYGHRRSAGRAALRTLLTYEEPGRDQADERPKASRRGGKKPSDKTRLLFPVADQAEESATPDYEVNGKAGKKPAKTRRRSAAASR